MQCDEQKKYKLSFQPVHFMTLLIFSRERLRWSDHHLILLMNLICPGWLEHLFVDVANRKRPSNPPTDLWLTDNMTWMVRCVPDGVSQRGR